MDSILKPLAWPFFSLGRESRFYILFQQLAAQAYVMSLRSSRSERTCILQQPVSHSTADSLEKDSSALEKMHTVNITQTVLCLNTGSRSSNCGIFALQSLEVSRARPVDQAYVAPLTSPHEGKQVMEATVVLRLHKCLKKGLLWSSSLHPHVTGTIPIPLTSPDIFLYKPVYSGCLLGPGFYI